MKALHDTLQGLITEARALQGKDELSAEEQARAESLPEDIAKAKEAIERAKSLDGALTAADEFLNAPLKHPAAVTNTVVDPDKAMAQARTLWQRSPQFQMAGHDREAAAEKAYRFGMFCMAALRPQSNAVRFCKEQGIPLAVHTEGINEDGGVLVPPEFENDIIVLREQYGVFRSRARYTPMGSDVKNRPRRTGGLTAYFVGETASITQSTAGWDNVQLMARKLAVLAKYSSELGEDAIVDFGDTIAGEIAYAFANKEDDCGFNGDGTSTYGKITGVRQRLIDVFTTGGGTGLVLGAGNAWSELTLANFRSVEGALPAYAETGNVAWFCHKKFWSDVLLGLALAGGGVPAAEIVNGIQRRFLGYPVVVTQIMPSAEANSQVPCILGDLALASMFGDRRQTTIAMSDHVDFASDQINVRGIERFDINVHDVGATGTAGPVVGIITAAA